MPDIKIMAKAISQSGRGGRLQELQERKMLKIMVFIAEVVLNF